MRGSDVDSCLVCDGRTKEAWVSKLRVIRALLERAKAGKVILIPHAKVPVAKVSFLRHQLPPCVISTREFGISIGLYVGQGS